MKIEQFDFIIGKYDEVSIGAWPKQLDAEPKKNNLLISANFGAEKSPEHVKTHEGGSLEYCICISYDHSEKYRSLCRQRVDNLISVFLIRFCRQKGITAFWVARKALSWASAAVQGTREIRPFFLLTVLSCLSGVIFWQCLLTTYKSTQKFKK